MGCIYAEFAKLGQIGPKLVKFGSSVQIWPARVSRRVPAMDRPVVSCTTCGGLCRGVAGRAPLDAPRGRAMFSATTPPSAASFSRPSCRRVLLRGELGVLPISTTERPLQRLMVGVLPLPTRFRRALPRAWRRPLLRCAGSSPDNFAGAQTKLGRPPTRWLRKPTRCACATPWLGAPPATPRLSTLAADRRLEPSGPRRAFSPSPHRQRRRGEVEGAFEDACGEVVEVAEAQLEAGLGEAGALESTHVILEHTSPH